MHILALLAVALLGLFAVVLFFGAPYLPTLKPQIHAAFELLNLPRGATILELGSGDGKVLLAAAEAGYHAIGVELNPVLVLVSLYRTRAHRDKVKVVWGNYWNVTWPPADGVYTFLLDKFMPKLDARMQSYRRPLASVTFRVPGREHDAEKDGVFYYHYR